MKELLISLLNFFGLAVWIEIDTENPTCTYYFGPFLNKAEANSEKQGYIEDIQSEDATVIKVNIKRCKPSALTILETSQTLVTQPIVSHLGTQL
ncbi:MAG: DUF1816 domain-containing protein [Microcoleaceae cyanobacterium]